MEGLGTLKRTMKGHISDVLDGLDERCNVVRGMFEESVGKMIEGEIGGLDVKLTELRRIQATSEAFER
jgi:hypothetical protein